MKKNDFKNQLATLSDNTIKELASSFNVLDALRDYTLFVAQNCTTPPPIEVVINAKVHSTFLDVVVKGELLPKPVHLTNISFNSNRLHNPIECAQQAKVLLDNYLQL